ncbi:hypothetical protein [Enemella evansiae]|uniref:hypothetical protein n=1 Tax=Enemella evansiae TaxID=2016499 RepID=UPI000B95F8C2|nr:hypothetical protein [Enemella evansiae]OYO01223.1 hypothetical protein CGZ97_17465 [Enemella evansiae]
MTTFAQALADLVGTDPHWSAYINSADLSELPDVVGELRQVWAGDGRTSYRPFLPISQTSDPAEPHPAGPAAAFEDEAGHRYLIVATLTRQPSPEPVPGLQATLISDDPDGTGILNAYSTGAFRDQATR